jgi:hypothetical protein
MDSQITAMGMWLSGLCHRLVMQMVTNVSEEHLASIFRIMRYSETLVSALQMTAS